MLALLCVLAGLLISGLFKKPEDNNGKSDTTVSDSAENAYLSYFKKDETVTLPLLPTDIEGIYYTMSVTGEVKFYSLSGGSVVPEKETGVYEVTALCSNVSVPASVHYIEKDGKLYGCGLYTSSITPGVHLYAYAFFKLTELPDAYESKNKYWLLIDVDSSRFYSPNKVYGEAFYYNPKDNSSEKFLSEVQRTPGIDGISRADYKMFTDEILVQPQNNVLFFSGRFYQEGEGKYDIFSSGGYDMNKDNLRQTVNVLDFALFRENGKYYYLRSNSSGGFDLCSANNDGKNEAVVKAFGFDYKNGCLRSGKYLYAKNETKLYGLTDGTASTISLNGTGEGFTVNMLTVSRNGRYAMLRGADAKGNVQIVIADIQSGKTNVFTGNVFTKIAACNISDDGEAVLSVADTVTPSPQTVYHQLIYTVTGGTPAESTAEALS